jgi:hypothetical protein
MKAYASFAGVRYQIIITITINGIVNGNTTWFEGTFNLILAETKFII